MIEYIPLTIDTARVTDILQELFDIQVRIQWYDKMILTEHVRVNSI